MNLKHILFSGLSVLLFLNTFAQYADCTPDYSVEDPEGVGIRSPVDLPVAFLGEHYSTVFTIIPPITANTWGVFNTTITKVQITELVNLPNGLVEDSNADNDDEFLYGGEYYCYTLDGYPVGNPGIHTVEVYANAWIRILFEMQAPGNPQFGGNIYFTLCNELDLDLGGNQTITTDDEITLNANQNNSIHTYAWSNGCTEPTCTISGSDLGVGTHEISVVVSDTIGTTEYYAGLETRCFKTDMIEITITEGNSVSANHMNDISVYPNPSTGTLSIEQNSEDNYIISILNLNGELVYQSENKKRTQHIDISHLSKGMYILKISSKNFNKIEKLILK